MKEPLVTVIIPVYNVEKYLDRCVSSVTGQTYQNLEIFLIDDGSPDNCPAMCDAWARRDSRIRVIHQENTGQGIARNAGIENASGEYVYFVDADDYIAPETIEICCREAFYEKADVVVFGLIMIGRNGEITHCKRAENEIERRTVYREREVQETFLPHISASLCLSFVSMKLIQRTGWRIVSERDIISEDTYSLLKLYKDVECVVALPNEFYYCRYNPVSFSRSYREDRFEKVKAFYEKTITLCSECGYNPMVLRKVSEFFIDFSIAAAKQITTAPIGFPQKISALRAIIFDDALQGILEQKKRDKITGGGVAEESFGKPVAPSSFVPQLLRSEIEKQNKVKFESKVSVIVPAYNAEKTLGKCLDSLLAQDYDNYEIIVVDDGSEDNTKGVAESYGNEKITYVRQTNAGVSAARNAGIALARGEYIIFCDADDCVSPYYISALMDNANGDSLVICALSQEYRLLDSENTRVPSSAFDYTKFPEKLVALLEMGYVQSPCCKLFQKSVIVSHDLAFDQSMCFIEDAKFSLQYLSVVRKIIYVNRTLYFYNRANSTLTNSSITHKTINSYFAFVKFLSDFTKGGNFEATYFSDYYNQSVALNYYALSLRAYAWLPCHKARMLRSDMKAHPLVRAAIEDYFRSGKENYIKPDMRRRVRFLVSVDSEFLWGVSGFLKRWKERVKQWKWSLRRRS